MDKRLFRKQSFLWRIFTFSGYITPKQFWSEIITRCIGFFCAMIFLCIVLSATVPGDVEDVKNVLRFALPALGVLWSIPLVVLSRRRLRDAGFSAKSYLWLLLPVAGWIVFLVRLCARTAPRKPEDIWFEYD
jgi:uncharacterized membrane protein YhaH (DUF805 family)